jgi:hypothetical protein
MKASKDNVSACVPRGRESTYFQNTSILSLKVVPKHFLTFSILPTIVGKCFIEKWVCIAFSKESNCRESDHMP